MAEIVVRLTKAQARALVHRTPVRVPAPQSPWGYRYEYTGPAVISWPHGVRPSQARQAAEARVLAAIYNAFPDLAPDPREQEAMTP